MRIEPESNRKCVHTILTRSYGRLLNSGLSIAALPPTFKAAITCPHPHDWPSMTSDTFHNRDNFVLALITSMVVTLSWFLLTWRYGFDFGDEGYYWYGAQRVLRGEVPIRDFLAYDFGRYIWAATVMSLLGDDGIWGARVAAGIYQALTICIGTFLALQALDNSVSRLTKILFAIAAALILNLWAIPYYKAFDYGTSILIVAMLAIILTSLSRARWFGAGLILGLAAIMGRNHGVYGACAGVLAVGFLTFKRRSISGLLQPVTAFIVGTILSFSLTLVMEVFNPGFMEAFIAGVIEHVRSTTTATNIPLPMPWPWTVSHGSDGWILWGSKVTIGTFFIALLLVPVLTILALSRQRIEDFTRLHYILLAAAFAALMYAHYAYSRADVVHLALSIFPLILILLTCGVLIRQILPVAIALISLSVIMILQDAPIFTSAVLGRPMQTVVMNGSEIYVRPFVANHLQTAEFAFASMPNARENFLAIPNFPSLYALNRSKIAIWEIYSLSARDAKFEEAELARLKKTPPEVVLLSNHALDDRPQLRYSNMHPVMYGWILDNYRRMDTGPLSKLEVYVRNTGRPGQ